MRTPARLRSTASAISCAARKLGGGALVMLATTCGFASQLWAAGSVEGTVKLDGTPPKLAALKVGKDVGACGAEQPNEAAVVGKGGVLKNVVVSIKNAPAGAPPAPSTEAKVDQVGCRYLPHVQSVNVGTKVALSNNDAILHNVHGNQGALTVFNVAMPIKGQTIASKKLDKPGVIKLQCDAGHTWMNAYVHVFPHPFHAVTDERGHFKIDGVPPGKYTLDLWHEGLDPGKPGVTKTVDVTVADGQATKADASIKL